MKPVEIHSDANSYVIRIEKDAVDKAVLMDFLEKLQLEDLAHRVGMDDSILEVGEEINASWWRENKHRFVRE